MTSESPMLISEMIAELEAIRAEHGDLPVYHYYAGGGCACIEPSESDAVVRVEDRLGGVSVTLPDRVVIDQ